MPAPPSPAFTASHPPAAPSALAERTRALAVACTLALVLLGLAWELWLAPTGRGTLAIKVLPLAFALAGLLKLRMRTYRWLSLLVWIYFAEGVVRASTELGISRVLALAEVGLSLVLFVSCAAHVRGRLRLAREGTA
jgi:uncharacterized membrane protein